MAKKDVLVHVRIDAELAEYLKRAVIASGESLSVVARRYLQLARFAEAESLRRYKNEQADLRMLRRSGVAV